MKKITFAAVVIASLCTAVILTSLCTAAFGQNTNSQTVSMNTGNAIQITFTGSGNATGGAVTLAFNNVSDYANGVISTAQEMEITSNKNFNVAVKSSSTNFTYSGSTSPAPTMPVSGILKLQVSANTTGGSIASPFTSSGYASITSANQNLINAGTVGSSQLFSVIYQATPGFAYPAGMYTVDVVYTATQL